MNTDPDLRTSRSAHACVATETMAIVFALLACAVPLGAGLVVIGLLDAVVFLRTVAVVVALVAVLAWRRYMLTRRGVRHAGGKVAHELAPETIMASIRRSNERNPDYLEQLARRCGRGEHLMHSQGYTHYLMNKACLARGNSAFWQSVP